MTEALQEPLWTGAPAGTGARRWFDVIVSLFGLLLMLVATVFCTITIWTGSPELVTAYGVLVFCFGVWFVLGRRLGRRRRRRSSQYTIGPDSLTLSIAGANRVIALTDLSEISVVHHKDGTGTIWAKEGEATAEPLLEAVPAPEQIVPLLGGVEPEPGETG